MVGAAIKSIPVFGWILAGISALIALVSHFVGKANEARKHKKNGINPLRKMLTSLLHQLKNYR